MVDVISEKQKCKGMTDDTDKFEWHKVCYDFI